MAVELPEDVAEEVADWLGIYGAHEEDEQKECRCCFVSGFTERIRQTARNEIAFRAGLDPEPDHG